MNFSSLPLFMELHINSISFFSNFVACSVFSSGLMQLSLSSEVYDSELKKIMRLALSLPSRIQFSEAVILRMALFVKEK